MSARINYNRITGSNIQGDATTVTEPLGTLVVTNNGDLRLHDGTTAGGNSIGAGSTGNFTFEQDTVTNTNGMLLSTGRGTLSIGRNMEGIGLSSHFHIAFDNSNISPPGGSLFLGDDYNYFKIPGGNSDPYYTFGANISTSDRIGGGQYIWRFDTDGKLTFPDGATIKDSTITASTNNYLYLYGGTAQESSGQSVRIYGTNANTTSTSTVYNGGNVRITSGRGVNGGEGGYVRLRTYDANNNSNSWYFNADGKLTLPASGTILSGDSLSGVKLSFTDAEFTDGKYITVRAGGDNYNHLHIDSGDNSKFDLFLGDDNNYVKVNHTGDINVVAVGNADILGSTNTNIHTTAGDVNIYTADHNGNSSGFPVSGVLLQNPVIVQTSYGTVWDNSVPWAVPGARLRFWGLDQNTGHALPVEPAELNDFFYVGHDGSNNSNFALYHDEALTQPVDGTGWTGPYNGHDYGIFSGGWIGLPEIAGDVNISAGSTHSWGVPGKVNITTHYKDASSTQHAVTWAFNADGKLQLPSGGDIVDSTGTSVLFSGSYNDLLNIKKEESFSIKIADFNATVGGRYGFNTTAGVITATLPASPAPGDAIWFADASGTASSNNLIIDRNGQTIMGSASNMTVNVNDQSFGLFYNGTTWRVY